MVTWLVHLYLAYKQFSCGPYNSNKNLNTALELLYIAGAINTLSVIYNDIYTTTINTYLLFNVQL